MLQLNYTCLIRHYSSSQDLCVIIIWVHQARMRCTALYINLTYNFRRSCTILLNHVIACTYYEIIIYVRRNNILHCWYINVLFVLVVPIISGDKLTHETISSCHICFKWFLKAVFQILSTKVHRCIHQDITISSTLTRAWRGLEPTQTT